MATDTQSSRKTIFGLGNLRRRRLQTDTPASDPRAGSQAYLDYLTAAPFSGSLIFRPEDIMKIPTVAACVNIITTSISRLPFQLVKKDGNVVSRVPPLFKQFNPEEPVERTLES